MFWTDDTTGTIRSMPTAGGTPVDVAHAQWDVSTNLNVLATDSSNLYWSDSGGTISKMPLSGGTATTIVKSERVVGMATDAKFIYFTTADKAVKKVSKDGGGAPTVLAMGQPTPYGITVDATNVYWANYDDGTIMKAPIHGGSASVLSQGPTGAHSIAVDGTNAYWTVHFGTTMVAMAPLSGGTVVTLASSPGGAPQSSAAIATDGAFVYWSNEQSGALNKVPIGGGATTSLGSPCSVSIVLDASGAYCTTPDAIFLTPLH